LGQLHHIRLLYLLAGVAGKEKKANAGFTNSETLIKFLLSIT
jgi:hypothetical protein